MHICKLPGLSHLQYLKFICPTPICLRISLLWGMGPGAQMLKHVYLGHMTMSMPAEATALRLRCAGTSRFLSRHLNNDLVALLGISVIEPNLWARAGVKRKHWHPIILPVPLTIQIKSFLGRHLRKDIWFYTSHLSWGLDCQLLYHRGYNLCRAWIRWHCSGPSGCPTRLWAWRPRQQEQNKTIW